jgi:hypothetical protein
LNATELAMVVTITEAMQHLVDLPAANTASPATA